MIALEPESRPSFEAALQSSRNVVFPDSFYSFFHQYISSLNELSSPSPFSRTTPPPSTGIEGRSGNGDGLPLPSDCDRRIESIWTEFSSVMPFLVPEEEGAPPRVPLLSLDQANSTTLQNIFPVHIHIPQLRSALRKPEDQIPQATATGKFVLPPHRPSVLTLSRWGRFNRSLSRLRESTLLYCPVVAPSRAGRTTRNIPVFN